MKTLSGGMVRRVGIAQAIVNDPRSCCSTSRPRAWIPSSASASAGCCGSSALDSCVVVSTHLVEDVAAACEDAILLDRGRLVFRGSIGALEAAARRRRATGRRAPSSAATPRCCASSGRGRTHDRADARPRPAPRSGAAGRARRARARRRAALAPRTLRRPLVGRAVRAPPGRRVARVPLRARGGRLARRPRTPPLRRRRARRHVAAGLAARGGRGRIDRARRARGGRRAARCGDGEWRLHGRPGAGRGVRRRDRALAPGRGVRRARARTRRHGADGHAARPVPGARVDVRVRRLDGRTGGRCSCCPRSARRPRRIS